MAEGLKTQYQQLVVSELIGAEIGWLARCNKCRVLAGVRVEGMFEDVYSANIEREHIRWCINTWDCTYKQSHLSTY